MAKRSAKTIDLDCPGCGALLELDRGFAGGVCRCSTCGTLMTVPAMPTEKAERLERPGDEKAQAAPRPDRPERPDRPGSPASFTKSARPGSGGRSGQASSNREAESESGEQTYRTASGREVRVDVSAVPTAAKRRAVRAATAAVFCVVVAGVLALCGLAAYLMLTQPTADDIAAALHVDTFPYDASADPFTIGAPNVLGLPLAARTAVVLDTAGMSSAELAALKPALLDGFGRDDGNVRWWVWLAGRGGSARPLLEGSRMGSVDVAALSAGLDAAPVEAVSADARAAVAEALSAEPSVLILVTGRDVRGEEASAIQALVTVAGSASRDDSASEGSGKGVRLDAVMVEADSFGLEDAARATGGYYVTLDLELDVAGWGGSR